MWKFTALGCGRANVACRLSACLRDVLDVLSGEAQMFAEEPAWNRPRGGAAAQP